MKSIMHNRIQQMNHNASNVMSSLELTKFIENHIGNVSEIINDIQNNLILANQTEQIDLSKKVLTQQSPKQILLKDSDYLE